MDSTENTTATENPTEAQAAPAETTTEVGASVASVVTTENEAEAEPSPFEVLGTHVSEAQEHPHVPTAVGDALQALGDLAWDFESRLRALEKPCEGCAGQPVHIVG